MKQKILDLIIAAKRDDPETGSFAEWLAEYLVANGVTVQEWIPVEERLPEAERIAWTEKHPDAALKVLAIIKGSYQAAEMWYSGVFDGKPSFWGISYDGESTISYAVTHWMPLPEPPGKDVSRDG